MTKKKEKTHTFRLYVIEEGDSTVGIPGGEGPISITVPDWFISHGDEGQFEQLMALELEKWTDGGRVLTSIQKMENDEAEERVSRALKDS